MPRQTVILVLILPSILMAGPSRWEPFGIGGGGHTCVSTFHPAYECEILVGSDVTGLFRTFDGGENWHTSLRGLSDYYIRHILVHPEIASLVFACTGSGLSRSTDGGESWETALELVLTGQGEYAAAFSHVAVDPIDPNVIWAAVGAFRFSDVAGPGGDNAGEYPHLWRSEALGSPGSWVPIPHDSLVGGPAPDCGIHSVLPLPFDWEAGNPGSEMFMVSTTDSVWMGYYDNQGTRWVWLPRNGYAPNRLPHGDARDLEAKWDSTGNIERLYIVLNSVWDRSDSGSAMSIYEDSLGYGGGVWYSDDLGVHWFPTSFVTGEDSFRLDDGYVDMSIDTSGVDTIRVHFPKNMRHLAINQQNGKVYVALTWRKMANEGVWVTDPSEPVWRWRRITESRTYGSWPLNMDHGYFTALGGVDGLAVQQATGDVLFNTNIGVYRCRGGDCTPGDATAPVWENIALRRTGTNPDTYTTRGINVTQVFGAVVAPSDTAVWFLSVGDIGLLRSDDNGASWRQVVNTDSLPYTAYNVNNCHGIFFVPHTSEPEVLGIFGRWKPPQRFGLWRTVGLPDTSSSWVEVPGLPYYAVVRDVEFLTRDTLLVGTNYGVYRGIRPVGGTWNLVLDMAGVPLDTSYFVNDIVVVPGTGSGRRVLIALGRYQQEPGGIFYRDGVSGSWSSASYLSGPLHGMEDIKTLCWSKVDPTVVYAGNASAQFGSSPVGGVLKSTDGGESWSITSQIMGDYSADAFDVVGVETLLDPGSGGALEWIYAGLYPHDHPPERAVTFGGIFVSTDSGETWIDRSDGLEGGHGLFLRSDATNPQRLFFGMFGNGIYRLVENFDPPSRRARSSTIIGPRIAVPADCVRKGDRTGSRR